MNMNVRLLTPVLLGALAVGAGAFLSSCSKENATTGTTSSYVGSGSKWTASFNSGDSTFALTYDADVDGVADMTVNGSYTEFSNKVKKLTVSSASGTNAPTVGDIAYGLEMPGYAFFLKPVGSSKSEPIVMLYSGSCPSGSFSGNWMKASFQTAPTATSDAFGDATFTLSGTNVTSSSIGQREFNGGAVIGTGSGPSGQCSSGVLNFNNGAENVDMYFTSNGGALVKTTGGIIFATPKFTGASDSDLTGTYTAIVFSGNKYTGTPNTFIGKLVFSAGSGTGNQITTIETDVTSGSGITLSLTAISGGNGLFTGTMNNVSNHPVNCVLSSVDGSKLIGCNGAGGAADGSGNYNNTFFMLGVSR